MSSDRVNLLGLPRAQLETFVAARLGAKPFRARQLMKWIYRRGAADFSTMSDLAQEFRAQLAQEIRAEELHRGLESERILEALVDACANGVRPDAAELALALEDRDRRLLFEIAFESAAPSTWAEAQSCLAVLRRRRAEEELTAVQKQIESFAAAAGAGAGGELRRLLERKQELRRRLDPPAHESPH